MTRYEQIFAGVVILAVIGAIVLTNSPINAAVIAALASMVVSIRNGKQLKDVSVAINGRLSQMLEVIKQSENAKGFIQGVATTNPNAIPAVPEEITKPVDTSPPVKHD